MRHCDCCDKDVDDNMWDGLFTCCNACAFESSLGAFPCDHGLAELQKAAVRAIDFLDEGRPEHAKGVLSAALAATGYRATPFTPQEPKR